MSRVNSYRDDRKDDSERICAMEHLPEKEECNGASPRKGRNGTEKLVDERKKR